MKYPDGSVIKRMAGAIDLYAQLAVETGAAEAAGVVSRITAEMKTALKELRALKPDPELARKEPDAYERILALRPDGPRNLAGRFDGSRYRDRLEGALLARMAGCTLGAIVEGWPVEAMEEFAREIGDPFPPAGYWSQARQPLSKRYAMSACYEYTRGKMDGVPVDDDIAYTLLGLLIAEDYGLDFTVEDVGKAWVKYLPYACTAEEIALNNLRAGVPASRAAVKDNPYVQWIGADIRSDPWGYLAPGNPEKAAAMAYRDAYVSHRRNGIYGEMFFSAAIAAAFAVDSSREAIEIGLTEIPKDCLLAKDVRWALKIAPKVGDFREGRALVDARFKGMHPVHTNNNACLTIFGLILGGRDVTKVLGDTVAMGLDNDCTAATAGSIAGAVVGKGKIPKKWTGKFNNTVKSYLNGLPVFAIDDLVNRFARAAGRE